jgi:hypothetical protein
MTEADERALRRSAGQEERTAEQVVAVSFEDREGGDGKRDVSAS